MGPFRQNIQQILLFHFQFGINTKGKQNNYLFILLTPYEDQNVRTRPLKQMDMSCAQGPIILQLQHVHGYVSSTSCE